MNEGTNAILKPTAKRFNNNIQLDALNDVKLRVELCSYNLNALELLRRKAHSDNTTAIVVVSII